MNSLRGMNLMVKQWQRETYSDPDKEPFLAWLARKKS